MPSTHSSSIAFFGTYLSLSSLFLPLHPRVTSLIPFYSSIMAPLGPGAIEPRFWRSFTSHWGQRLTRIAMAAFFVAGAWSVCWSRIRLGHHTRAQVFVGASLGSAVALAWLCLWLGVTDTSAFLGVSTQSLTDAVPVPHWLLNGVQEQGLLLERAVEDVVFVAVEAWQEGRLDGLKQLSPWALGREL